MQLILIPLHLSVVLSTVHAGVVAKEDEICRGVEYLQSEMRSLNLELIRGHYLLKEVERVTKDLKDLLALRKSDTGFVASLINYVRNFIALSRLFAT